MEGLVTKSTGSWYTIRDLKGNYFDARIRGKIRLSKIKHTNPVAVGDRVEFKLDKDQIAVIEKIFPRSNYIIRRSVNLSKQTHIIASNIDVAFLISTIKNPRTSTGFIDRFLVTCNAYEIPVVLVFNKIDDLEADDIVYMEELISVYENIGYKVMRVSALQKTGLEALQSKLKDKVSLVAGHSGVGKSTLVNALSPELNIKTKNISDYNQKGKHTTTFAQMYPWDFGGFIIDTPGIKEFGLVEMEKDEIQDYFPEIFTLKHNCKFNNCSHTIEPKCAVLEAVNSNEIAESRYISYLTFLEESDESSYTKS